MNKNSSMQTTRLSKTKFLYGHFVNTAKCTSSHRQLIHRAFGVSFSQVKFKTLYANSALMDCPSRRTFSEHSGYERSKYDPKNDPEVKNIMKNIMEAFGVTEKELQEGVQIIGEIENETQGEINPQDDVSKNAKEDKNMKELDDSDSHEEVDLEDDNSSSESDSDSSDELNEEDVYQEEVEYEKVYVKHSPIPLKRGETGVYDVKELVEVLRSENAHDICVIKIPETCHYVDYMVIATGSNTRHIRAMAEWVKWIHKRKKHPKDNYVLIAGKESKSWMAMDMGNIVLHLMSYRARAYYDLETLWTVGAEFDEKSTKTETDPYIVDITKS